MSDLLKLASSLRQLSDEQLKAICQQRQVSLQAKDFLEVAEQLLSEKSIESALAKLTRSEASALNTLLTNQGSSEKPAAHDQAAENLVAIHALATKFDHSCEVLAAVKRIVETKFEIADVSRAGPESNNDADATNSVGGLNKPSPQTSAMLDSLSAISAFEFQLGLTELVLDLEHRNLKLVGKQGISSAEYKRLATGLRKPLETAKAIYYFAQLLHLIEVKNNRWQLTASAFDWLKFDVLERLRVCSETWISLLSLTATSELSTLIESHPDLTLSEALEDIFVFADRGLKDHLRQMVVWAEWCGLAVQDQPTSYLRSLLRQDFETAKQLMQQHLPRQVSELIIQADQTLIAPGPLATELEVELRQFVELEQVSVATSYRITAMSITHGLEVGLTEDSIRALLSRLSSKPLPQPIDYLIRETAARFMRLTLSQGEGADKTLIKSTDGLLLTEIVNDIRLRPYGLRAIAAQVLSTRFDVEVVYFALRENGYLAVRVDENHKVISPLKNLERESRSESKTDRYLDFVQSLRAAESRLTSEPSDDDLIRQLQLAIKNKTEMTVHLTMRDGRTASYQVLPKSVANGRLRALDSKADAERVLPVAQINRIEF